MKPLSIVFLVIFLQCLPSLTAQQQQANTTTSSIAIDCDFNNDACRSQFNGVCQASIKGHCFEGDCYDCDPCHEFHYDACGCVDKGCLWCPGDAFCSSKPLEKPIWQRIKFLFQTEISSSCESVDDWVSSCTSKNNATNVFQDPLYDAMKWAYDLINVESVWKRGILGQGVRIRVNDNGIDASHPELASNFDIEASCFDNYLPNNLTTDIHGTAVASIVAGNANNGQCAVGIAPNATLSSCVLDLQATTPEGLASTVDAKLDQFDISVNAWGIQTCRRKQRVPQRHLQSTSEQQSACIFRSDHQFSPCHACTFSPDTDDSPLGQACEETIIYYCALRYEHDQVACSEYLDLFVKCGYNTLSQEQQAALARGVHEGRDGKGVIYVFSSGNAFSLGVDANFDGWVNSRHTLAVGAVGKAGLHASYSTTGAALFAVGPGGDSDHLSNNIVAVPGGGCGDITIGTSFATPFVAGVIALVLEVNPNLSWRDVQCIVALTSQQVEPDNESWARNAAGLHHSYQYGFGLVDAEAAVNAAETWKLLGPEHQILVESGFIDLSIADDPLSAAVSALSINATTGTGFVAESCVVYLDLVHASRGDLSIVLTSPHGTESILHPSKRPENTHLPTMWKLMTVRSFGESPVGNWTISLVDESPGILNECVDAPFEYTWDEDDDRIDGAVSTCATLEMGGGCAEGNILYNFIAQLRVDDVTAQDACCACGGGMPASTINSLRSWRLVVYGHIEKTDPPTAFSSMEPTFVPNLLTQSSIPATASSVATSSSTPSLGGSWINILLFALVTGRFLLR